jgi:uncharacterized protein YdhG (YjbR/CyaY superfamily)
MKTAKDIDAYIADFPEHVQEKLEQMRKAIHEAAPGLTEAIGYGIPTFKLNGNVVHFGGFKNHIGFYPAPQGLAAFKKELSKYKGAKGSVQFPHDEPLPLELVKKITKYRVKVMKEEAKVKAEAKAKTKDKAKAEAKAKPKAKEKAKAEAKVKSKVKVKPTSKAKAK